MKQLLPAVALLAAAALFGCDRPGTSTSSTTIVKEPTPPATTSTVVVQPATPPATSSTSVTIDATKPETTETTKSTTRVDTPMGTATKRESTTTTTK